MDDIVALVKGRQAAAAEPVRRDRALASDRSVRHQVRSLAAPRTTAWSITRVDAELLADLAGEGLRPKSVVGQPVHGLAFRSTVAIVDPASYDDKEKRRTLGSHAVCSGARIGPTTILTAAHCVCDLALHTRVRQVRIGADANTNSWATAMSTVPGRTVCYPGSGDPEVAP